MTFTIIPTNNTHSPIAGSGPVLTGRHISFMSGLDTLIGQAEMNSFDGTYLGTDTALFT
jgi:hypothetical protein